MIKMLIVDDEPLARNHVKRNFPWQEWGIEIIGEAANGLEALTSCRRVMPDLMLIDITMPVMDGFALIAQLKQQYPKIKAIFLTAHRNFDFAKKALQVGAAGYILKSPIDVSETKAVIEKVSQEITKTLAMEGKQQKLLLDYRFPLRQKYFSDISNGTLATEHEIMEEAHSIGLHIKNTNYYMFLGQIHHAEQDQQAGEIEIFEHIQKSLAALSNAPCELFPAAFGNYVILVESTLTETSASYAATLFNTINEHVDNPINLTVSFIGSDELTDLVHLKSTYQKLNGYLHYGYYFKDKPFMFIDNKSELHISAHTKEEQIGNFKMEFIDIIQTMNLKKLDHWIVRVQEFALRYKPDPQWVMRWLNSLKEVIPSNERPLKDSPDFYHAENLFAALQQLAEWTTTSWHRTKHEIKVHPQIAKAIHYIKNNLDQDLTLHNIAEEVYLSPSYLGRLLKKEMGLSLVDYILKQRIHLAKKLMRDGVDRNYEIAEQVGFNNYSYFCTTFKKLEQKSPNEYRHELKTSIIND